MLTYLWIAVGGALGSVARYACTDLGNRWFGDTFPWGTIAINVLGSFVIGFFGTLTGAGGRWLVAPDLRFFVMVGVCGGYTTFSSFSLQTLTLLREGDMVGACGNVVGSVVVCMLAVWLGFQLAAALNGASGALRR